MATSLPYGSWPSEISAAAAAAGSARFEGAIFVRSEPWWGQSVDGRMTVFRAGDETPLLAEPWSARSKLHMYGGGSWTASDEGTLFFVEGSDQRIYRMMAGEEPTPLTPADSALTFGALTVRGSLLIAVREKRGGAEIERDVVLVPIDGSSADSEEHLVSLASGTDFVAQPTLSPDARQLAWVGWNHPDMPWDRAMVFERSLVSETMPIALSEGAGLQPQWSNRGDLFFSDDRTGRWNLRAVPAGSAVSMPVAPADADTGGALWVAGLSWYRLLDDGRILAVRTNGRDELALLSPDGERTLDVALNADITVHDVDGTRALISGAGTAVPGGVWLIDVDDDSAAAPLGGGVAAWDAAWLPRAEAFQVEGKHGQIENFFYAPTNPDADGPDGALPPVVLMLHGGPTSHASGSLSPTIAYFTSRGIAVCEVNYGGSTGYGREYRERLRGEWGVVDVDDTISVAEYLAQSGRVDAKTIAVRGGSAGGWTVLNALAQSDLFAAGIARYPVTDARALASDDGEFESRYFDGLIGPLPEAEQRYIDRSPLTHAAEITSPLLLEQGSDDPVVPQSQAELIRDAVAKNDVPYAYLLFEGEGHGFRQPASLIRSLEAELGLLAEVMGFESDAPSSHWRDSAAQKSDE